MNRKISALAAAAVVIAVTGCSTPAPTVEPIVIERDKTLNRVSVRDDSALMQDETVGGAAFRMEEDSTQVLYNDHHIGDSKYTLAQLGLDPEAAKIEAERKAAAEKAVAAKKAAAKNKNAKKGSKRTGRDRSIYSKDKSIYSKAK